MGKAMVPRNKNTGGSSMAECLRNDWNPSNSQERSKSDDRESQNEKIVFGVQKRPVETLSFESAETMWQSTDICSQIKQEEKEKMLYRSPARKPLGKSEVPKGQDSLPDFVTSPTFVHGMTRYKNNDGAKELINLPQKVENQERGSSPFPRLNPGQQFKRNYQWEVDLETTVFGMKSQNDNERRNSSYGVQQTFAAESIVSPNKVKPKILPEEMGPAGVMRVKPKNETAADIMNQCVDDPLTKYDRNSRLETGKNTTHGSQKQVADTKVFGCPTVRHDLTPPAFKSVANNINYGDDVNVEYVMKPSSQLTLGLQDGDFTKPRSKEFLVSLFRTSGFEASDEDFDVIFNEARRGQNVGASIEKFKSSYNDVMFSIKRSAVSHKNPTDKSRHVSFSKSESSFRQES